MQNEYPIRLRQWDAGAAQRNLRPDVGMELVMPDVLTIRQSVARAKIEGLPVAECALRRWIKAGVFHGFRMAGSKVLVYYPALVDFLQGR